MAGHLSRKKLLIVSDTAMWKLDKAVYVFEPTLREVEHLTKLFERIVWLGFDYGDTPSSYSRPPATDAIECILLPSARGGDSFFSKLKILRHLPVLVFRILRQVRRFEYVHTRGPSIPALIVIVSYWFSKRPRFWHKYAGNWVQDRGPFAYRLQKQLLRRCGKIVTVNGQWPNEPRNIVNLENPCISVDELTEALELRDQLGFSSGLVNLCFVGGLNEAKGIWYFLRAIPRLEHVQKIGKIFVVGDGPLRRELEDYARGLPVEVKFKGNLFRDQLNRIYSTSDILVLPSETEGFPKVVAEAMAFGCVPVVSGVSSLGQYIQNDITGILLGQTNELEVAGAIDKLLSDDDHRIMLGKTARELAQLFTYERYCLSLETRVFPERV